MAEFDNSLAEMAAEHARLTRNFNLTGASTLGFLRTLFFGVMLGCMLGLWVGINIGKDRPILANPFDKEATTSILE